MYYIKDKTKWEGEGGGRFLIKFSKIKLLHFNTYKPYYSDIHCMFFEQKLFCRKKRFL